MSSSNQFSGSAIHALRDMGYTDEQARIALQASAGNVQRAVQLLLDQDVPSAPQAAPPRPAPASASAREQMELQQALAASRLDTTAAPPNPRAAAAAAAEARHGRQQGLARPAPAPAPQSRPTVPQPRPAVQQPRPAVPQPRTASSGAGEREQRVQACAARLAGRSEAVDTLILSLSKVLEHPQEERYRKVNISNRAFQERVASAPGGMEFMYAVGFEPMHGFLVLQSRDLALLWIGKSALEKARGASDYAASKERAELQHALALSNGEYEAELSKRRAAFGARVPDEPAEGLAGNSLICVHLPGERQVWRRFESCSTLEDLLNFVRSCPEAPLNGVKLSNVTMSPPAPLDLRTQLGLTLQRLEMWPTGHVRVERE